MKREVKVVPFDKALGLVRTREELYSKRAGCEIKSLFGARIFFVPGIGDIIDPIGRWTRKPGSKPEAEGEALKAQQMKGRKVWTRTRHPNRFEQDTALYDAIGRYAQHIRPYYEGGKEDEDGEGEREELYGLARDIRELRTLLAILPQAPEKIKDEIQQRARELAEKLASDVFSAPSHVVSVEKLEAWEQLVEIVPLADKLGRLNPVAFQARATAALDRIDRRRERNVPSIQTHLSSREKALILEEAVCFDTLREAVEAVTALGKTLSHEQRARSKEGMATRTWMLKESIAKNWRCKPFNLFARLLGPTLNQFATSLEGGYWRSTEKARATLLEQLKACCAVVGILRQHRGLPVVKMLRSAMRQVKPEQLPIQVEA